MLAKLGLKEEPKNDFFGGMGGGQKSSTTAFGASSSSGSIIPSFTEEPACAKCCPKLTYKQRLYGFIGCAGLGYLLSWIGFFVLAGDSSNSAISTFAALYVVGNVIALMATGFLLGPRSQCTKMWHPTRRYTTAFYLTMLIVVFSVAVACPKLFLLVLFLLFIQMCAGVWYAASYIPYGRKMILAFLRRTCCGPCFEAYDGMKGSGGGGGGGNNV